MALLQHPLLPPLFRLQPLTLFRLQLLVRLQRLVQHQNFLELQLLPLFCLQLLVSLQIRLQLLVHILQILPMFQKAVQSALSSMK